MMTTADIARWFLSKFTSNDYNEVERAARVAILGKITMLCLQAEAEKDVEFFVKMEKLCSSL